LAEQPNILATLVVCHVNPTALQTTQHSSLSFSQKAPAIYVFALSAPTANSIMEYFHITSL